jgi:hypothetical protein
MRVKIMTDKTPIYVLSIIGMVLLVAIVYYLTGPSAPDTTNMGSAISGNVVADDSNVAPIDFSGVGRFIVGAVLLGVSVYLYTRNE